MDIAFSIEGVPVRLTTERWFHIVENHDELAGYYDNVLETIEQPQWILRGHNGAFVAVQNYGHRRYLSVIYRQVSADDGFVITAYFTTDLDREKIVWKRQ